MVPVGPAKLCQALQIDRELDGVDLLGRYPALTILAAASPVHPRSILRGPRFGIPNAGDWRHAPPRFGVAGSLHLSKPFR